MSGIFTLGKVGIRQGKGTWSTASDVWLIGSPVAVKESPFGYFGGGVNPATIGQNTNIRRIDYSNDAVHLQYRSFFDQSVFGVQSLSGVASLSHGYFAGGSPHSGTVVRRLDFANDTAVASPRGLLESAAYGAAATGNQDYGYFGGGELPSPDTSTVQRIDYSNDLAMAVAKGPLSEARHKF